MTKSQKDVSMRYIPNYHGALDKALQTILQRKYAALVVGCSVELPNAMDVQVANMSNLTRVLLVTPCGEGGSARATLEEEGYTVIDVAFAARNLLTLSCSVDNHTSERTYVMDGSGTSLSTFVMDGITNFMQKSHIADPYNEHNIMLVVYRNILKRIGELDFGISIPKRPCAALKYIAPKLYEKRLTRRVREQDQLSVYRSDARKSAKRHLHKCLDFLQ